MRSCCDDESSRSWRADEWPRISGCTGRKAMSGLSKKRGGKDAITGSHVGRTKSCIKYNSIYIYTCVVSASEVVRFRNYVFAAPTEISLSVLHRSQATSQYQHIIRPEKKSLLWTKEREPSQNVICMYRVSLKICHPNTTAPARVGTK
jgi:hypothetical protein